MTIRAASILYNSENFPKEMLRRHHPAYKKIHLCYMSKDSSGESFENEPFAFIIETATFHFVVVPKNIGSNVMLFFDLKIDDLKKNPNVITKWSADLQSARESTLKLFDILNKRV